MENTQHLAVIKLQTGVAYGAGGICYASIAGVHPSFPSSLRHRPGMKPPEQGF